MFLDSLDPNAQFVGRLFVGFAFGDELQDFQLARGQGGVARFAGTGPGRFLDVAAIHAFGDFVGEKAIALHDLANGVDDELGGGLLDQKSARAGGSGFVDIGVVAVGGEHDDSGGGRGQDDLAGGFQAVEQRHGDVHEDDVGPHLGEHGHGFTTGFGFADDVHVRFEIEHAMETFADDRVIFGEEDRDFLSGLHDRFLVGRARRSARAVLFGLGSGAHGATHPTWSRGDWCNERNDGDDGSAFAGSGLDGKYAANHFDALAHAEQAEAFAGFEFGTGGVLERSAVVHDAHGNVFADSLDAHFDAGGVRMACDVVERFLRHAEKSGAAVLIELFDFGKGDEVAMHAGLRRESLHEHVQRGDEAKIIEHGGTKLAREIVDDIDGFEDERLGFGDADVEAFAEVAGFLGE